MEDMSNKKVVLWKESKVEEFPFELQFDIKHVSNLYPDLKTNDSTIILANLPEQFKSETYNIQYNGRSTTWEIKMNLEKPPGSEQIFLVCYLKLLECREANSSVPLPQFEVYATFGSHVVNNHNEVVLNNGLDRRKFISAGLHYGEDILSLKDFWEKKDVYYPDDTFRLRITLKLIGRRILLGKHPSQEAAMEVPSKKLKEDMSNLLSSKEGSDVQITCGEMTLKAHRVILSARSPVFRKMLNTDMVESRSGNIVINDLEADTVKLLVKYLYTAELPEAINSKELMHLSKAADKYQLDELKQWCFTKLSYEHLTLMTCGEIAILAYLHGACVAHKKLIHEFCVMHWGTLVTDTDFQKLMKAYPDAFFPTWQKNTSSVQPTNAANEP